jgi:hypothetical protein
MQLAFSDGSHIVDNPTQYAAAHRRLGVGAAGDPGSIAAVAAQGAATTGGILAGLSAMGALSPVFAIAGPIGAAVAGLVSIGLAIASQFQGCGNTCVEATAIANQIEPILNQNLQAYLSAPVHYASMQAAALNNFDTAWNALVKACGQQALQQAGANCISDRQAGACVIKNQGQGWVQNSTGQWSYVTGGAAGSGTQCWDWWKGYRDPISQDPTVVPDPTGAIIDPTTGNVTGITTPVTSIFGTGSGASLAPLLLIGGGLVAVLMLVDN